MSPLGALIPALRLIAEDAASRILAVYASDFDVHIKADGTPVTAADLAAHACISEGLRRIAPEIPVLSEESAHIPLEERSQWQRLWLVDPLDGTREFVNRTGEFSVNIALIEDHRPVLGLIQIPVTGVCYYAWEGGGAHKALPGQPATRLHSRPLGDRAIEVASGRSFTAHPLRTYLQHLGRHHHVAVGSALKSCLVAEGTLDLYPRFGPTCEWDTAAAQIILTEAGGRLTDLHMRPLRYNARSTLLNPDFFAFGDPHHDWSRYLPRRKPRL